MQSKNAAPRWGELWYCDLGSEDACTGLQYIVEYGRCLLHQITNTQRIHRSIRYIHLQQSVQTGGPHPT